MAGYYPGGKRREEELRTGTLSGEKALGVEGTQSGTGTISGENARMKSFQGGAAAKMPYQSGWSKQLNDTMDKILNREPFQYDLNGDALYQQYKDRYVQQGEQAMMNTMGQAAALTGGYGNSYAQAAGQQAYNQYLQGLDDRIPELYQLALDKYRMEGDQLDTRAAFLAQMDGQDYGRWLDNRKYQYQQGRDEKSDQQWQAQFDEDKWRYDTEWEKKYGKKPDRGGNGEGSQDPGTAPGTNPAPGAKPGSETGGILDDVGKQIGDKIKDAADDAWNNPDPKPAAGGYAQVRQDVLDFIKAGKTKNEVSEYIHAAAAAGEITPSQAQSILRLL